MKVFLAVCVVVVSLGLWLFLPFFVFDYAISHGGSGGVVNDLKHGNTGAAAIPFILIARGVICSPLIAWLSYRLFSTSGRFWIFWGLALALCLFGLPIVCATYLSWPIR